MTTETMTCEPIHDEPTTPASSPLTITIPAGVNVSNAAGGNFRYAFSCVACHQGEDGTAHLIATNGRILAITPVQADGPIDGPVYFPAHVGKKQILKGNGKPARLTMDDEANQLRRDDGKVTEVFQVEKYDARFPDVKRVLPASLTGYTSVTLDADYLHDLAHAIGDGKVTLLIPPANRDGDVKAPVCVVGQDALGKMVAPGIGVIMPISETGGAAKAFTRLADQVK